MGLMRSPAFLGAVAMTVILALYVAFVANYAWVLINTDAWQARALGVAMMVLPLIAGWYLIIEWRLGMTVQKMARDLQEREELPSFDGEVTVSGRLTPESAEVAYEEAKAAVDAQPEQWEAWFRVAYAYEENRDRSMARKSLRHAADLFRAERRRMRAGR
ncbi:hypothetical protein [Demequina flava]|uniref:hypothetical protein n=1 Tax=Demequina flava TaxID=1095025 RepID=UPI0007864182|nr:hypothetical protein [Demequina flava]